MRGRGAYYIRKSTKKQEEATQVETIGRWLVSRSLDLSDCQAFEDTGSRHKAHLRADFQRLLRWVESGEVQWVVVSELDRFGSKDPYELMSFIHQLREAGCELWSCADNKCLSEGDDLTIMTNVFKAITSEKEQYGRSARALRSLPDMAKRGEFTGGRIPFALDVECRRGEKVLWRYTPGVGCGTVRRDGSPPEEVPKLPVHDHRAGERAFLVPSIEEDRIEALRSIFRWFATEELSYSSLARRLVERKVVSAPFPLWTHDRVNTVINNPVYRLGVRPVGRTTQSQFHRLEVDEGGNRTLGLAPNKTGRKVAQPSSSWMMPSVGIFEGLIDEETWSRVLAKVESHKTVRAPRSDRHWLAGLVVCDRCGLPMYSWNQGKGGKVTLSYRCRTADRASQGKSRNVTGCARHIVKQEVLVPYVEEFLKGRGERLDEVMHRVGDSNFLKSLLEKREATSGVVDELYGAMERVVRGNWSLEEWEKYMRDVWGAGDLLDVNSRNLVMILYSGSFERRKKQVLESLDRKRAELDQAVASYRSLPQIPSVQERANRELTTLAQEIEAHEREIATTLDRYLDVQDEVSKLDQRIKEARVALAVGTDTQKADAARRLFKEIRCTFEHRQRTQTVRSILTKINIVPLMGDASEIELRSEGSAWRSGGRPHKG